MKKKLKLVTGNKGKYEEVCLILPEWEIEQIDIDLEEIQGNRAHVLKNKAHEALKHVQAPLLVEDVSVEFSCLNGLPGPYIKDFLKTLGETEIAKLVGHYEDRSAIAYCTVAYIEPGAEPVLFEGSLEGTIVLPRGGTRIGKYSWNGIFQPKGMDKTMGEISLKEHGQLSHRSVAYLQAVKYIEEHCEITL